MARRKLERPRRPLPTKRLADIKDAAKLLDIIRGIALKNRGQKTQVFYPIRDVARHFGVPISTVGRIYKQLEGEGVLASVRGSKTLLQGLSFGRQLNVRGFVAMPTFTPHFVTLQDYRTFFIRTRRELRARGFAVATIFFDRNDLHPTRLVSRIDKYEADTILWHQPDRTAKETLARLKDSGVQVLGISDRGFPAIRCRYEVQREPAIAAILREWRSQCGIRAVVAVRGVEPSAAKEELLKSLFEEENLQYQFISVGEKLREDFLDSLPREKKTGIVFPSMAASMCAFRAPAAFARLMSKVRVALTGGPVSIPFAEVPDVAADLVVVDWQLVAERIVGDLINRKAFDYRETTVFEAKAHLRAPLKQYAQSL